MSRTTLNIDDSILRQLKRRSKKEGKPLGELASELLAEALAEAPRKPGPLEWFSADLKPLVDLDDTDAVYEILDRGSHQ